MPSTGTLVFNDQKLQAPEMYVTESLGVGVSVPTSNLEVVGNVYVSSNLEVTGRVMAGSSKIPVGVDRNDVVVYDQTPHDRPLTKYPEIAMTANSSGGYVASASSQYAGGNYDIWKAHDGERTNAGTPSYYYSSSHEIYGTTNGAYAPGSNPSYSTTSSGTAYTGEYVQMQFPTPIKLSYVRIVSASTSTYNQNAPKQGVICGSNDGTTWTTIATYSGITYSTLGASADIQVSSGVAYNYIRLVVTHTGRPATGGSGWLIMEEIDYYGYEEGDVSTDLTLSSVYNKPGTEHLEVYWDANDTGSYGGSGTTVTDLSGNGVTGTLSGVGFDSTYNAFTFDGSNDDITGTLSNPGGDYVHSVSWWFKPTQTTQAIGTNEQAMWFMGNTWGAGVCSYSSFYGDRFYFGWHTYNINCPTTDISQTQWNHACVTYTGGGSTLTNRSIYINGVKQFSSLDNTPGQSLNLPANTYLVLGNQRGQSKYFNGSIANVRLFSKALNADQVKELYDWQKDHFLGSRSSMTLYKGNLGLGVAEPTSRLEIAGNERIQEYPPRAMTGYETYMEGHGVFRASASSLRNGHQVWHAFEKTISSYKWPSDAGGGDTFGGTDSAYNGTNRLSSSTVSGAWLKLELPYKIKLNNFSIYSSPNSEQPEDFFVYGSVDDNAWEQMFSKTGAPQNSDYVSYNVNSTSYYKYFAIVITRTISSTTIGVINEWRLFGTPAPSTLDDGHLTLGKQLSTPRVSGHAAGAETPRAESLVVHYDTTLDGVVSGSTVVDTSGSGNNGTFNGNATYSSSDRAMTFDGTGDKVTASFPSSAGDNTFSVSFWMKRAANNATYCPFFLGDATTGEGIGMDIYTNGSVYWFIYGGKNFLWTGVTGAWFPVGVWTHVAVSHTAGTDFVNLNKVWINGIDVSAGKGLNGPNTADLSLDANDTITLGARVGNNYLNGSISNFKIWGGVALTADEVAAEYALGRTGKALNVTDTAVCLGGTAPRAQLDVRGSMIIDGIIKHSAWPAFRVTTNNGENIFSNHSGGTNAKSSGHNNNTNSSDEVIPWKNVVYDNTGSYTYSGAGDYKFTAPVSGIYHFHFHCLFTRSSTSSSRLDLKFFVNGGLNAHLEMNGDFSSSTNYNVGRGHTTNLHLNAGNFVQAVFTGVGGQWSVYTGGGNAHFNVFSGQLIAAD